MAGARIGRFFVRGLRAFVGLHVVALAWLLIALPGFGFMVGTKPCPEPPGGASGVHPASRLSAVGALHHCHLAGTYAERGFACGQLTASMMEQHEIELFSTLESLVPFFGLRHLILGTVTFNNADLDAYLLPGEIDAIAGIALGYRKAGDPHAHVGPAYARILGYHALHDASQYMIDNPLINAPMVGCTSFALDGDRTTGGHLLVGRLFDFEGGRSFDLDKVVYTVAPREGGQRFVHVAWGGVHGAVTGMNESGLWLSVNAGISDGLARTGRPLIVAVHHALEHCRTIDEAVKHLTGTPVFVSESVLIASRNAPEGGPRAVVLELAPHDFHVRPLRDDWVGVANHFEHEAWQSDGANQKRMAEGTTLARRERLEELVLRTPQHTPASALEVLRDRRGAGDEDLGFGNRSSINAWIGAHAVVADIDSGILWVAEPSHGLARALAFDVNGPRDDVAVLPESDDLARFDQVGRGWKGRLEEARRKVSRGDADAAAFLDAMVSDNPQHYEPFVLRARLASDPAERLAHLRSALERRPAYARERQGIVDAIEELSVEPQD